MEFISKVACFLTPVFLILLFFKTMVYHENLRCFLYFSCRFRDVMDEFFNKK